ncbi:hypothetical protein MTR67_049479 [Solanum verrucosum]|uniref:Uncharacterized protein n=1 Tax=Solanum verrucosum TaxID=315347 RepID=A0AAF0UZS4_SOLVR|nr:hypothetical protein MTR67_049478 [Solanum verrucosum]WMV56094.1 hypothetical protein MTR67_049479 [Solanum verrucosum]
MACLKRQVSYVLYVVLMLLL